MPTTPPSPRYRQAPARRTRRAVAVLLLACGLLSAHLATAAAAPTADLTFTDPAFRQCVSGSLRQPSSKPITKAQAETVITLVCEYPAVANLGGVQALPNLTSLYLDGSTVSDLTPLSGATQLRKFSAPNSPINDLSPLQGLTDLTRLEVTSAVDSLAPVSSLTKLTFLSVGGSSTSFGPLSSLTALQTLWTGSPGPVDISALGSLTTLQDLRLDVPNVADVTPLRSLTGLTKLYLNAGKADLSVLGPMRQLQELTLSPAAGSRHAKAALAGKPDLTDLVMSNVPLSSLDLLASSTKLHRLTVYTAGLRDVSALKAMPELTSVTLSGVKKASFKPLKKLPKLDDLTVFQSRLGKLSQFRGFPALTSLNLSENKLTSLKGFKAPTTLTYLNLSVNRLANIDRLTCGLRIDAFQQSVPLPKARVGRPYKLPLVGITGQTIDLGTSPSWTASGTKITYEEAGTFEVPFSASGPTQCGDSGYPEIQFSGVVLQKVRKA